MTKQALSCTFPRRNANLILLLLCRASITEWTKTRDSLPTFRTKEKPIITVSRAITRQRLERHLITKLTTTTPVTTPVNSTLTTVLLPITPLVPVVLFLLRPITAKPWHQELPRRNQFIRQLLPFPLRRKRECHQRRHWRLRQHQHQPPPDHRTIVHPITPSQCTHCTESIIIQRGLKRARPSRTPAAATQSMMPVPLTSKRITVISHPTNWELTRSNIVKPQQESLRVPITKLLNHTK